jgi:hypothetical protein
MIKVLNKLVIKENYLNIIKAVSEKPTADIILGTKQGCSLSSLLFNIVWKS